MANLKQFCLEKYGLEQFPDSVFKNVSFVVCQRVDQDCKTLMVLLIADFLGELEIPQPRETQSTYLFQLQSFWSDYLSRSTIFQGRLSLKDCYYFTGFNIDLKQILNFQLLSLSSAKIPWGDMSTLKPITSHLNILYLRPIVNYKYHKVRL